VIGRYVFHRLRRALLPEFQRAWTRDLNASLKDVRATLADVQTELAELRRFRRAVAVRDWEQSRAALLASLDARLDAASIGAHAAAAIADAAICEQPAPHVVIDRILPPEFYDLLTAAIPPPELFPDRDPVKQDFEMAALGDAPRLSQRVWRFFDDEVVGRVLGPALLERFHPQVAAHYGDGGGETFGLRAADLPHRTFAGRIQLRRPGYSLAPHLDPKRVVITGLLFFPRPGDSEEFGTQLFSVDRPFVQTGTKTFFPEQAGLKCTLARTVPYRGNTLLAFVNSRGAHGAVLPPDAPLLERYAYQFYVKPIDGELKKLLRTLPPDAQAAWGEMMPA
jgi:hypothetical protein